MSNQISAKKFINEFNFSKIKEVNKYLINGFSRWCRKNNYKMAKTFKEWEDIFFVEYAEIKTKRKVIEKEVKKTNKTDKKGE